MRRVLLSAIAVLLFVRVPAAADDPLLSLFERYVEALRRQAAIPGLAVAIVGQDQILWERGFGYQDVERSIAARPDTPFHIDGITQIFTAALALRCAEENRLSLEERISRFLASSPDPDATIRQVLTHTAAAPDGLAFTHGFERFPPLTRAIRSCTVGSYRKSLAQLFVRFTMRDSVPGPDILTLVPPAEGIPEPDAAAHYRAVLERLAKPYAVDRRGRATPSTYVATELTPATGVISSVRDLAEFDLGLRKNILLRDETLVEAWTNPTTRSGQLLPHGIGWFVQNYKGEPVVWQFGVGENASSSLIVTVPNRKLTFILLANSDGLVVPLPLAAGDLTVSPFGKLLLRFFVD